MLARQALDSLSYLPSPALEFSVSPGYPQTRCVPLNIGPSSADSDVLELKVCVPPHTAVFMLFFSVQKIKKKRQLKRQFFREQAAVCRDVPVVCPHLLYILS